MPLCGFSPVPYFASVFGRPKSERVSRRTSTICYWMALSACCVEEDLQVSIVLVLYFRFLDWMTFLFFNTGASSADLISSFAHIVKDDERYIFRELLRKVATLK